MRLGGNIIKKWQNADEWGRLHKEMGYTACYFPVNYTAPQSTIDEYVNAAHNYNLVISEVGIWNNMLDPNSEVREKNIQYSIHQLELADYVGANCCVNIAGTYNPDKWDGHHKDAFTKRCFDDIVLTSQKIIDAVNPKRTEFSLEPMPWMYPDTPESYMDLIKAINRKGFGAHVDIVNIINDVKKYYDNTNVILSWFKLLGPYIKSCHAKDIFMPQKLTLHLDEVRPGLGNIDYATYITCVSKLAPNVCLMLEHMTEEQDYVLGVKYVKGIADSLGLSFEG